MELWKVRTPCFEYWVIGVCLLMKFPRGFVELKLAETHIQVGLGVHVHKSFPINKHFLLIAIRYKYSAEPWTQMGNLNNS